MDNLFQSKWFIRIISLMLAISLYFFATFETNKPENKSILPSISKETVLIEDVPLQVEMDSENYVVSGVPEYVKVTLEGRASVLAPIVRQKNFSVYIDLTELGEGDYFVDIKYKNIPDDVAVYIDPKTIEVIVEERASKEFPVEVDFINLDKLPIDYEIGEIEITPELVTIVSSSSVIDRVAMVKVYVDVTDLKESIRNREVPISVSDIQGNDLNVTVEPGSTVISVQIDRPSKRLPVSVQTKGELPEGLTLVSLEVDEEVDVFGKRARLAEIEEILTEEIDLSTIDSSGEIDIPIVTPDGLVTNEESVKVQVVLEQTRTFEDVVIDVVGQGDRLFTFVTPEEGHIDVDLIGEYGVVSKLEANEIELMIDITDIEIGEHELEVELTKPKDTDYKLTPSLIKFIIEEITEE